MKSKYKLVIYFIIFTLNSSGLSQSIQELQKLRAEYEKYQNRQSSSEVVNNNSNIQIPEQSTIVPFSFDDLYQGGKSTVHNHFGYNYFTKKDTILMWDNLPAPSNYILGSGDELIISLWGETQLRKKFIIDREGKIYDEKVGLLNMAGKTLFSAQNYLKTQFGRVYSTINGNKPTTFFDVSLGQLRMINVNFVGELKYPGVYPIHPFSTLITGLLQSGGVDTTGSLRKIQIKRDGKLYYEADLYEYLIKGEVSSKIQLRDQDIIVVPPRQSYITIDSAIARPGIYEALEKETVYDMIQYAGGLIYNSSDQISIRRIIPYSKRNNDRVIKSIYTDYSASDRIQINNGDIITVFKLLYDTQKVEIIGQIKAPGYYNYFKGMTLLDLFNLASGFNDSTFLKSVYIDRAEIIRRNPDTRYDQIIGFNINEILNGEKNIDLINLDRVVIHENLNFFEKANILIYGEVNIPGSYPLLSDNETLQIILDRAGGLTSKAYSDGIEIYRKSEHYLNQNNITSNISGDKSNFSINIEESNDRLRVAWKKNITLMPGDSIIVNERSATVFVTGSIYNPGILEYIEGKPLRYYINAAGGLTEKANKEGIIVLYANGIVSPKKWYNSPDILQGSTIIVNDKLPEEPFNITQFATNWTSIISSMITAIVLAQQVNN